MVQWPPADMANAGVEFTLQALLHLGRTNTSTESTKKRRLTQFCFENVLNHYEHKCA